MPHEDSDRERRHRRRSSRELESDRERRRETDQHRRRRTHRATDSQGELLLPKRGDYSSRDRSSKDYGSSREPRSRRESRGASSGQLLSSGSLAQLDSINAKKGFKQDGYDADYLEEVRIKERRMEKERKKADRDADRETRRAERREERLRAVEDERRAEEQAERDRLKEEDRIRRKEEKRQSRKAEKERQRVLELEETEAEERELKRVAEREKQRALRKERERERRRRERDESYRDETPDATPQRTSRKTRYRDEVEYGSSPIRKTPRKTAYRDEVDYASSPAPETPIQSPRKAKWWWSKTTYEEIDNEDSPRAKDFERVHSPKKKTRVLSGPALEDARRQELYEYRREKLDSGSSNTEYTSTTLWKKKRNKRICIYVSIILIILIIIIAVAVAVSQKHKSSSSGSGPSSSSLTGNLNGLSHSEVPVAYQGTYYDPWTWYDTVDFNVTFTSETVGGLPIIGLNSTWNDNVQANSKVPNLQDSFAYGTQPIRGMNIGGWLSIEPFITPSLFNGYGSREGVIDEWTLTTKLGSQANATLERHYSSFITKQAFADIRAAGFDHVRISFSYWAVKTYAGDPYVPMISWRYLLRGIEYCRQNGLRVNLDMHGLPGSQNGWNHSGRQGVVGWLNGTNGALNAQRSLDIHNQLSTFFTQPRYKNLVTMYGLVNEPRMVELNTNDVLTWTTNATRIIQANNFTGIVVFGDGFMGLDNWQGKLTGTKNLLLDVHQYVVFNNEQINYDHSSKLNFACGGWTAQTKRSQNTGTGFGPTLTGEWSQADTDCVTNLNNVGVGSRWTGTLNTGNASTEVLSPQCYLNSSSCTCSNANADPSTYSSVYKDWLLKFALGQMESFEYGWGWFYWTWKTENAVQWSWQLGAKAGILPSTVYDRSWSCNSSIPNYAGQGLSEAY